MGFREEIATALETAVAEANGNQNEAARRMGLKTSVTLRHWVMGARSVVSEALNDAMNSLGYHLCRDGEERPAETRPVLQVSTGTEEEERLRKLVAKLKEELAKAKAQSDAYEALVIKIAMAKEEAKGDAKTPARFTNSPA